MRWAWLAFVVACGNAGGPFTLTIEKHAADSRVTGNGIDCGTNPTCGEAALDACAVELDAGTAVSLVVQHPICPPGGMGGIYFTFGWSKPCNATPGRTCMFEITDDVTVIVTGVSAVTGSR